MQSLQCFYCSAACRNAAFDAHVCGDTAAPGRAAGALHPRAPGVANVLSSNELEPDEAVRAVDWGEVRVSLGRATAVPALPTLETSRASMSSALPCGVVGTR